MQKFLSTTNGDIHSLTGDPKPSISTTSSWSVRPSDRRSIDRLLHETAAFTDGTK